MFLRVLLVKFNILLYLCMLFGVKMRYEKDDLQEALRVLRDGGIILYPTDTVWGIGCDATNPEAVAKIYALKQREDSKSMLVLLDSPAKLN